MWAGHACSSPILLKPDPAQARSCSSPILLKPDPAQARLRRLAAAINVAPPLEVSRCNGISLRGRHAVSVIFCGGLEIQTVSPSTRPVARTLVSHSIKKCVTAVEMFYVFGALLPRRRQCWKRLILRSNANAEIAVSS
jgi:hypothetical protein